MFLSGIPGSGLYGKPRAFQGQSLRFDQNSGARLHVWQTDRRSADRFRASFKGVLISGWRSLVKNVFFKAV